MDGGNVPSPSSPSSSPGVGCSFPLRFAAVPFALSAECVVIYSPEWDRDLRCFSIYTAICVTGNEILNTRAGLMLLDFRKM